MEHLIIVAVWFWLMGSILVGCVASEQHRGGVLWSLLSFFAVGPLLALIALAALETPSSEDDERGGCPYCAEDIKPEAILCPHCRSDLSKPSAADRLVTRN
jgi:hypothetical protein